MGNPVTTPSRNQDTQVAPLGRSDSEQAASWGLTEQEWTRFEQIQAGPRGFWSPNLDPLTALGVEAQTDQERQRYAELQVALKPNAPSASWPIKTLTPRPGPSCFPGCCRSRAWHPHPLPPHRSCRAGPCL